MQIRGGAFGGQATKVARRPRARYGEQSLSRHDIRGRHVHRHQVKRYRVDISPLRMLKLPFYRSRRTCRPRFSSTTAQKPGSQIPDERHGVLNLMHGDGTSPTSVLWFILPVVCEQRLVCVEPDFHTRRPRAFAPSSGRGDGGKSLGINVA